MSNNAFQHEDESTLKISDLWNLVWNRKWWYVLSIGICLLGAAFYLYRTPVSYSRTAKLIVDESSQDATMRNLGVASANMMRTRMSFNTVENEMEAFKSPDLMQVVVERLGLQTRYVEKQFLRDVELYRAPVSMHLVSDNPQSGFSFIATRTGDNKVLLSKFKLGADKFDAEVEGKLGDTLSTPVGSFVLFPTEQIKDFKHPISISWATSGARAKNYMSKLSVSLASKESSVIVLNMQDRYPARAESVLNSLIDVYNEAWLGNKNRSAINTAEFINERLVVIEKELSAVEDALKDFKSKNNVTDIKASGQAYLQESTLYAAKSFELNNQLSIAKFIRDYLADPTKKDALIPSNLGLASQSVEAQIGEYNELVLKRDRLAAGSSENNPMISDINVAIVSVRDAILRSVDNLVSTLDLQINKINSQEKQVLSRIASNSGKELKLVSIQRQQQITENLYVFLLQKREENELSALVNVGNTRLIMNPNGSPLPVAPNKMMILLIALLLGFGVPFGIFYLIKIVDNTIKVKADLGRLSVPFLAEIPKSVEKKSGIIVEQGNRDVMNEAFRVLRTNLDLMLGRNAKSKVIMFTSFHPDAGKTFSTMNIAASMALKGSKVIMVDLDLRKASLSKALDKEFSGVAAYLNGKMDDYHQGIDSISETLDIIPVGSLPPNPAELLISDRFRDMLEQLKSEYDYVFLDCPPIDIVTDANIITNYVDLTVFVLRSGRLPKQILTHLDELYKSGKYNHMALMLNFVDMQYNKYGYGKSGYGYGYGYGYGN